MDVITYDREAAMPRRILHLEDNAVLRENTARLLVNMGYEYVPAATVEEAQEKYRQGGYDLVICDGTVVESLDGVRYASHLKQKEKQLVLIISADEKAERLAQLEGIPFLHKLDTYFNFEPTITRLLS